MATNRATYPKTIGNFLVTDTLGSGTFADVLMGVDKTTKQKVALKIIDTSSWEDNDRKRRQTLVKREICMSKLFHHPNIIQMINTFTCNSNVVIVQEHMAGGDLENYIYKQKAGYISEKKTIFFFRQIIAAVDYLHKNHVTHRDIKPANIIFDEKHLRPKLIDFGFTNVFDKDEKMNSYLGSPHYAAPELLTGIPYDGKQVDIWSLGVTLFTCLTGKLPFNDSRMEDLMDHIVCGTIEYPTHLTQGAKHMVARMLTANMHERASMEDLRDHIWLNIGYPHPPPDLAIQRSAKIKEINAEVLKEMSDYGFEEKLVKKEIIKTGGNMHKAIYCLLLEHMARQIKKQEEILTKKQNKSLTFSLFRRNKVTSNDARVAKANTIG